MSFENFGKVSFVSETKLHKFVEFLEQSKITATRCRGCGKTFFPPRADCDLCFSNEMEWRELDGSCTLLTYTTVGFAPPRFRYECPYRLAVAKFDEGPRVFAMLSKDIKDETLKIGMKLRLTPVKLMGGRITYELKEI